MALSVVWEFLECFLGVFLGVKGFVLRTINSKSEK